ncbi:FCD domain-containing protein [Paracoccus sp. YLB-12]|uniref:FCD domain-containing protein n=1 Tax=Paracoccus maritimus TaxID=2933292 RepID=A0ABT2KEB5_9RHOB|nr:FCD domain-containing protein [Paracoccus sp. YLB-12]MCT4334892.1 FCD domain-containing protein [Paracoccus sp. YLB-12]
MVGSAATWGWQRSWDRSYRRLAASTFQTTHSDKHQHIVKAIAAGDEAAASRAMTTHLMAIQDAFGDDGR